MPNLYAPIRVEQGTREEYLSLDSYDDNTIYFLTDTHQVFVGEEEYTSSVHELEDIPAEDIEGEDGRIYYHPESESTYIYLNGKWNIIFDKTKAIQKIHVGEGLETDSEDGVIVTKGTIKHYTHDNIYKDKYPKVDISTGNVNQLNTLLSDTHNLTWIAIPTFKVDEFGHVYDNSSSKMLCLDNINGYLRLRGSVDNLDDIDTFKLDPIEVEAFGEEVAESYLMERKLQSVGCMYYVESEKKYYYWDGEDFRPILAEQDLSSVIDKVPGVAGQVPMFSADGGLEPAGYTALSEVDPGTYGPESVEIIKASRYANIPRLTIDEFGRVTDAVDVPLVLADKQVAEDLTYFIAENYMKNLVLSKKSVMIPSASENENLHIVVNPEEFFKGLTNGDVSITVYGCIEDQIMSFTIDGTEVPRNMYTFDTPLYAQSDDVAQQMVVRIKLLNIYIESLSNGTHDIRVTSSTDEFGTGSIIVKNPIYYDVTFMIDNNHGEIIEKTAKVRENTRVTSLDFNIVAPSSIDQSSMYEDGHNVLIGYDIISYKQDGKPDDGFFTDDSYTVEMSYGVKVNDDMTVYVRLTPVASEILLHNVEFCTFENGHNGPFQSYYTNGEPGDSWSIALYGYTDKDVLGFDSYNFNCESLTIPIPHKDGYVFDGWYLEEDFSGERQYEFPAKYPTPIPHTESPYVIYHYYESVFPYYAKWIEE